MNENVRKVLKGFSELSETEKREILNFIIKYNNGGYLEKAQLSATLNESRTIGVTSQNSCPCCGKS